MTSLTLAKLNYLHLNTEFTYSHACGKLDYYIINAHFTVIFDSLRAINNSHSFLSWVQNKSFKLASHVAYRVPVLPSKVSGTKAFVFNP